MPPQTAFDRQAQGSMPAVGESQADFRQRLNLMQLQAQERRQQELGEQCSPRIAPADRIRIWERLHQLKLPRQGSPQLLRIIAANTGLSVEDVKAEQHARAAAKSTAVTR
jgi:hypothetical protein